MVNVKCGVPHFADVINLVNVNSSVKFIKKQVNHDLKKL